MDTSVSRALRRLRFSGTAAVAALVMFALLAPPQASAETRPDISGPALGASIGGNATPGGPTPEYEGALEGWTVGPTGPVGEVSCEDCVCKFTGPPSMTRTPANKACRIEQVTTFPARCPGSAASGCPDGSQGQIQIVLYGCCVAKQGTVICSTKTVILMACP